MGSADTKRLLDSVRARLVEHEKNLRVANARIGLLPAGEQKKTAALERAAIEQGIDFLRDWEKKLMKVDRNKRRHRAIGLSSKKEACHG